jgi:hypothetical protein
VRRVHIDRSERSSIVATQPSVQSPRVEGAEVDHLPFSGYAHEFAREVRGGIRAELAASTDQVVELTDGHRIGEVDGLPYWSFAAPIDPMTTPAAETPAQLRTDDGEEIGATAVAIGDESVTVALDARPQGDLRSATLLVNPAFVLAKLRDRIDDLAAAGADMLLIDELLSPEQLGVDAGGGMGEEPLAVSATEAQERAANLAVEPGVRFTWGPPGTGKTKGLDDLLPGVVADAQQPDLADRREQLGAERAALSDRLRTSADSERAALTTQLQAVREELTELERAHRRASRELIDDASVVVTTLARAVIDDAIWGREWDVVLVDEASMAPLPMVLAFAMRGPTTLSALGDPRQLPPVHASEEPEARRWFGRDLFEYSGFGEPGYDPARDPRLSALRIQFRMGETICTAVDDFAYDGLLRTDSLARNRGIRLAEARPGTASELVIIDTATLGGRCWADPMPGSSSRVNPTSGLLAASVGAELLASSCDSVVLVSPYRAQVRWLNALTKSLDGVTASTVHRLQGSEADAIVLDLVDAAPHSRPSRLTGDGDDPELATRLLTVAASRARGKLVVLVDHDFVSGCVAVSGPLRRFLDALDGSGAERLDACDLVMTGLGAAAPVSWHDGWSAAEHQVPDRDRFTAPGGPQPWMVAGSSLLLGSGDDHDGPAAVVSGSRVVAAFAQGVAGMGEA